MDHASLVIFGDSGLDRGHDLRAGAGALSHAGTIALWRGKPLIAGDGALVRLPADHPLFALAPEPPVLLGREDAGTVWAADLSAWVPDETDLAALGGFFDPTEQRHPDLPPDHRFAELRGLMSVLSRRDAELAATARALLGWHESHRFCARCGAASQPAQSGWQRDCPACGAHHFPRTDPVVIMLITHGNDLLLGRGTTWPEGMYSLLAGFIEPGETIEAAVRREVREESGVIVAEVGYVASQPWPFPASLMLGCRGRATSRAITVDPAELEAALWVSRERLAAVMAGQDSVIRPPRSGAIAQYLMQLWLADRLG